MSSLVVSRRLVSVLVFLACANASGPSAMDAGNVIKSMEARDHLDETCTVEMTVKSSNNAAHHREYYLDSEDDFRSEKNLARVISYDDAPLFKKAGIDDPAAYYRDKTIHVTGLILHQNDQTRIHVKDPKQIKLAEAGEKK